MTNSEIFKLAHTATKLAIAEQREIKHPSVHKSYRELFSLALRGAYLGDVYKTVDKPKFMWLRGM